MTQAEANELMLGKMQALEFMVTALIAMRAPTIGVGMLPQLEAIRKRIEAGDAVSHLERGFASVEPTLRQALKQSEESALIQPLDDSKLQ